MARGKRGGRMGGGGRKWEREMEKEEGKGG